MFAFTFGLYWSSVYEHLAWRRSRAIAHVAAGARTEEKMMEEPRGDRPWIRSRSALVLVLFLGVAGFFLITEHTAHVFGLLPYLLLLACPLMHFLHRGHKGGHGGHGGPPPTEGARR